MRKAKNLFLISIFTFSFAIFNLGWASNDWMTGGSKLSQLVQKKPIGYIGGFLVRLPEDRSGFYRATKGEKLPSHFDWRNNGGNWMTSAKDQGYCGSCAAFSAIGAFEAVINIANGDPNLDLNLSEQHLFSCAGGSCNYGMYIDDAMDYLKQYGVPRESCFPYTAGNTGSNPPCSRTCSDWQSQAKRITSWRWVNGDINSMKSAIYNYGPIVSAFNACDDLYYYDAGEIYTHSGSCSGCTPHGVVIVGWDDAQRYWIVKNSWGSYWGDNGFFKIRWGTCGIDSGYYSFGIYMTYTPSGDDDDDGGDDADDDSGDGDGDICDDVCYKFRYCDLIDNDVTRAKCRSYCFNEMTNEERICVHRSDTCGEVKDCMGVGGDGDDKDDDNSDPLTDFFGCNFAGSGGTVGGVGLLILLACGIGIWLKKKL